MRKTTVALLAVLLTALFVPLFVSTAAAGTRSEATPGGACATGSGVSVVVDLTDLGGKVLVGCAPGDPATGRQALTDAGFGVTDAPSGMICAIDSAPDPCPTTFKGLYWSYWSAQPGTGWTAYAVGADSSNPAPGGFEGWRYNDGSTGPGVLAADLQGATGATAQPTGRPTAQPTPLAEPASAPSDRAPTAAITGICLVVLLGVAAVLVVRRRRADATRD